jgi:hypothetical protein
MVCPYKSPDIQENISSEGGSQAAKRHLKVQLKTLMVGPEGVFPPGSMIEVSPEEARALIAGRFAESVPRAAAPPKDELPAVETAAIQPGSRAVRPEAKARKTP